MSDVIIKIGRSKEILLDDFKTIVANAKFYRDICRELDIDPGNTATIKKRIAQYGIDASHLEQRYPVTEEFLRSRKESQRTFSLSADNEKYFSDFRGTFDNQESWNTYKATIGKFLESLGDKDVATVSFDEILSFVADSKDQASHLKSLLTYIWYNDINGAYEKVDRDVLRWIMPAPQRLNVLNSMPVFPDEIDQTNVARMEGAIMSIFVNKYERDGKARNICLEKYGTVCSVCDKKMSDIYGEMFSEKIQVHHLTPMSKYDKEHEIDAIKELRPVCPNCHFIIHCRKGDPFTIEEVRAFIENTQ